MKPLNRAGLAIFLYLIFSFVADILRNVKTMAPWEMPLAIGFALLAFVLIVSE